MHWDTFNQDNYSTVGGDGGCRVGEVRAGTTSPMPDHKGFKLHQYCIQWFYCTCYPVVLLVLHYIMMT